MSFLFLNLCTQATDEDIGNAYRRLSRLYHPDKHMNPDRKKEAEILFGKTKKAYEGEVFMSASAEVGKNDSKS